MIVSRVENDIELIFGGETIYFTTEQAQELADKLNQMLMDIELGDKDDL